MKERIIRAVFIGSLLLGSGCAEKGRVESPSPTSALTPTPTVECPPPILGPQVEGPTRREFISPLPPEEWVPSDESYRKEIYAEYGDFFEALEWEKPPEIVLDEVVDSLKERLREDCGPSAENWFPRIEGLKSKTSFLEPYMFFTELYFPPGEEREKLIDKYQQDKKEAIIDLCFRIVRRRWGWLDLHILGGYDFETDETLINLGQVGDEWGKDTLAHELWHGLPLTRIYQDESGDWYRDSGFLKKKWIEELEAWSAEYWLPEILLPADIPQKVVFSTWRINEAFADLMQPSYMGPLPPFEREQELLERAFEVFGKNKVISLYLESKPEEFYRLVRENCGQFSDIFKEGIACPTR